MEELQAEKDAIAEERKKTEDMMAELMALKAQLASQQTQPDEEKPAPQETEESKSDEEAAQPQEKEE